MKLIETTTKQRKPITIEFSPYEQDVLRGIVGNIAGVGPYFKVVTDLWTILADRTELLPNGVLKNITTPPELVDEEKQVSSY